MKSFLLFLSFIPVYALAQPNPSKSYPDKIADLTNRLEKTPNDYQLIWERLNLQTALLPGSSYQFAWDYTAGEPLKTGLPDKSSPYYENEFQKIYWNVVQKKDFSYLEAGDFYMQRMFYYEKTDQIEKGISDAIYLIDSASYSRFWQRDSYFKETGLLHLFRFYAIGQNYDMALETIQRFYEFKYAGLDPVASFEPYWIYEVELFEYFGLTEKVVPFLKQVEEHFFEFFLKESEKKVEFSGPNALIDKRDYDAKMDHLKFKFIELYGDYVNYMKKYGAKDLAKNEQVYEELKKKEKELTPQQMNVLLNEVK